MGTKQSPGAYDYYHNALPDEPMFILLARDPFAPILVKNWADLLAYRIVSGEKPVSDCPKVHEARKCAAAMEIWRMANNGAWRQSAAPVQSTGFNSANLTCISSAGAWNLWHYNSDTVPLDKVLESNFFKPYADNIHHADHIHVIAPDGCCIASFRNNGQVIDLAIFGYLKSGYLGPSGE